MIIKGREENKKNEKKFSFFDFDSFTKSKEETDFFEILLKESFC
jgi:hypothetical protein